MLKNVCRVNWVLGMAVVVSFFHPLLAYCQYGREITPPSFVNISSSARLIGMGDASVAIVDQGAYLSNPAALAVSLGPSHLRFNLSPNGNGLSATNLAVGSRISGQDSGGVTLVFSSDYRSAHQIVRQYVGDPEPIINTNGQVSEYVERFSGAREFMRTQTVGLLMGSTTQFGFGISAKYLQLEGSRIYYPQSSMTPISAWNFDLGALARREFLVAINTKERTALKISPAVGVSCANLVRTHVTGMSYVSYPPLTSDGLEDIERSGKSNYVISSRMLRSGISVSSLLVKHNLETVKITLASEYVLGGDDIRNGFKTGADLSIYRIIGMQVGTGVLGRFKKVTSYGVSLSTAGFRQILFHNTQEPVITLNPLSWLQGIDIEVSYAHLSGHYRIDIPDSLWTFSVSL